MLQEAKGAGKLQTLRALSQRLEGTEHTAQQDIIISTLTSPSRIYTVTVWSKYSHQTASLIVDTGSAVSLIRHDVWKKAFKGKISSWNGCKLIGANGTALEVVGKVEEEEIVFGDCRGIDK